MWEWLISPIDPSRGHVISMMESWHARVMVLSWGMIVPAAVFVARYLKIMPSQDWPRELDNQFWWHSHWISQIIAYVLSLFGLSLILRDSAGSIDAPLHSLLGYTILSIGLIQVGFGLMRGSKGGPTDPRPDGSHSGDHYDMTRLRVIFEHVHRSLGYFALVVAALTILSGLWSANAPRWMWISILSYWSGLVVLTIYCQRRGWAYDTYQAIWGDDPTLAGNKMKKMGWWTVRPSDTGRYGPQDEAKKTNLEIEGAE